MAPRHGQPAELARVLRRPARTWHRCLAVALALLALGTIRGALAAGRLGASGASRLGSGGGGLGRGRGESEPEPDPAAACSAAADRLLSAMTLDEKVSQLNSNNSAIERLGLPQFNWWSECLHGFLTPEEAPPATLHPVPLGLAASYDTDLVHRVATAISDEARAYNADRVRRGLSPRALNCFSPNINLLRDPRWGRAAETWGEDPVLTGRMAAAFVRGLQGDHPFYLKVGATCKHFAVHSLESAEGVTRHSMDALVDERDLRESYLPAFRACVREGGAHSVMCSYNRVNGVPACANPTLLQSILGGEWGFDGAPGGNFVVSDCGAVWDMWAAHRYNRTEPQAAAEALLRGLTLFCDDANRALPEALAAGLLPAAAVDAAVRRLLLARCRLGILGRAQPGGGRQGQQQEGGATGTEQGQGGGQQWWHRGGGAAEQGQRGGATGPEEAGAGVGLGQEGASEAAAGAPRGWGRAAGGSMGAEMAQQPSAGGQRSAAESQSDPDPEGSHVTRAAASARRAHLRLSYEAAVASITLLINRPGPDGVTPMLPLRLNESDSPPPVDVRHRVRQGVDGRPLLAVFGPHANGSTYYLGTYYGTPSRPVVTPLMALTERLGESALLYRQGLSHTGRRPDDHLHQITLAATDSGARAAVVFVGSNSQNYYCADQECTLTPTVTESEGLDRTSLRLPGMQEDLIRAVALSGLPVVLVLVHGGPVDVAALLELEGVRAVLSAPYGGQQAGYAIADVLLGNAAPAGRLPVSWHYEWYTKLIAMTNMAMRPWPGRTYRYLQVPVLFPFGHGLSYSCFNYSALRTALKPRCDTPGPPEDICFRVEVDVTNTGNHASDHSVMVMFRRDDYHNPPSLGAGWTGRDAGSTIAGEAVGAAVLRAAGGGVPGASAAGSGVEGGAGACGPCLDGDEVGLGGDEGENGQDPPGPEGCTGQAWDRGRYGEPDTMRRHEEAFLAVLSPRQPRSAQRTAARGGGAASPGTASTRAAGGAETGGSSSGGQSAAGVGDRDPSGGRGGGGRNDDPPPLRELVAFGRLRALTPGERRTLVLEVRLEAQRLVEWGRRRPGPAEAEAPRPPLLQVGTTCCPLPAGLLHAANAAGG
ncbi:hypothetical protein HYH03_001131 [Edaphochlamys debaryana]|uniref:Uncharacterized protein n=1 Tax=Edaphochlamys debaryana TaxID=47281 RepID=A0A836C5L6_9CHLO|nr:hypothetical protein HYH03_001131 [Edaphochlamys debaryana]|eukprot:KAG2501341.1 hypothetical protein HYH03_001131 [Edaphochlamys debaryana]